MKLRRLTQSSAVLEIGAGEKTYQILFSFDFPAGIAVDDSFAVLRKEDRKLKSTSQHIEKWLKKRQASRELSTDDLADGIIATMRSLYSPKNP